MPTNQGYGTLERARRPRPDPLLSRDRVDDRDARVGDAYDRRGTTPSSCDLGLLVGVVETAEQCAGVGIEACHAVLPREGHRQSRPIAATTPTSTAWGCL
jgi:hypothetical protein